MATAGRRACRQQSIPAREKCSSRTSCVHHLAFQYRTFHQSRYFWTVHSAPGRPRYIRRCPVSQTPNRSYPENRSQSMWRGRMIWHMQRPPPILTFPCFCLDTINTTVASPLPYIYIYLTLVTSGVFLHVFPRHHSPLPTPWSEGC